MESLIKAGALDQLGSRAAQLLVIDACLEEAHKQNKNKLSGQVSLFDGDEDMAKINVKLPEVTELPLEQLLVFEKDLLGFYLHEPPYLKDLQKLTKFVSTKLSELEDAHVGKSLKLGGVIVAVKKVLTKKTAAEMAFVKISDGTNALEVVIFPKTYETCKEFLIPDTVVLIAGRVEKREEEMSLIVEKINQFNPDLMVDDPLSIIEEAKDNNPLVEINIPNGTSVTVLQTVNKTLRRYPGSIPVALLLPSNGEMRRMNLPFGINPVTSLEEEINNLLGQKAFQLI